MEKVRVTGLINKEVAKEFKKTILDEGLNISKAMQELMLVYCTCNKKSNEPAPKITQNNYGLRRIRKTRIAL